MAHRGVRIAIVGGGPSGSSMAIELVRHGVDPGDIVVFDRAKFPRPKLCGGALTFRGTEYLAELLDWQGVSDPQGGMRTMGLEFRCSLGEYKVVERGAQWLFDRSLLDDRLLSKAISLGVEVRQQTRVSGLTRHGKQWEVQTSTGAERFDWVVGADGARGVVGRAAGLKPGIIGRLVEAVYVPEPNTTPRPETLVFDFDPIADGIPGYAWIFPYPKPGEEGLYKIGVMDGRGVTPGATLRSWTDSYAQAHGYRRVEPKIAGWPEHYFSPFRRAHTEGLILVGEAWGIDPLLGEGIAPSLEMAMYAAPRLAEAAAQGRTRVPGYERQFCFSRAGRNLCFHAHLADLLYGGDSRRWLRVLFGHEYMMELAEGGTEAYGRLARRLPQLAIHYAFQVLRDGIPTNEPLPSRGAIERRGRTA